MAEIKPRKCAHDQVLDPVRLTEHELGSIEQVRKEDEMCSQEL